MKSLLVRANPTAKPISVMSDGGNGAASQIWYVKLGLMGSGMIPISSNRGNKKELREIF